MLFRSKVLGAFTLEPEYFSPFEAKLRKGKKLPIRAPEPKRRIRDGVFSFGLVACTLSVHAPHREHPRDWNANGCKGAYKSP